MNQPKNTRFIQATIALTVLFAGLSVTPILVSSCPTWTAYLTLPIPIVLGALIIYRNNLYQKEKKSLLKQIDVNVKQFLFNNGEDNTEASLINLDKSLKQATTFIKQIGDGNFDVSYAGMTDTLRELNQDNLSGELLQMKSKMIEVADEEKQRSWVASGIAHFSEIVRAQNKTFEEIINQFISELVKYMSANQGGIFIVNDTEPGSIKLELKGCYAYGRRKYIERVIEAGEGLVGQTYLEGDIIYLTDVPKNYISITSGLGEAIPRCVILVPLKNHDVIEGVLEIASFNVWKKFESDFLTKIGEILGSAITAIKVNEVTKRLLSESQEQAEQLRAQEEEMRQNLEELNATQEAIARKSQEAIAQSSKLNAVLDSTIDAIITTNESGKIESVNKAFTHLFDYAEEEVIGKNIDILFTLASDQDSTQSKKNLISINNSESFGQIQKTEVLKKDGEVFHAELVLNSADLGNRKIITCVVRDVSERIKAEEDQHQFIEELRAQEEEMRQNLEELESTQEEIHRQLMEINKVNRELDARVVALNTSTIMSESDLFGNIIYANDKFCEVSQYSREELDGQPHNMLRHPDMPKEVFRMLWSNIKGGRVFRGIAKNRKKDGSHYWVDAVISPVLGENGKPEKYIGLRYVIEDDDLGQKLFDKQLVELGLSLKKEMIAA